MHMTRHNGVIDGFYDDDAEDRSLDLENDPDWQRTKAIPRYPDFGKTFLDLAADFSAPSAERKMYVVSEVRTSYGRTKRRVVGVFDSKRDAERKAAEIRHVLVSFLERNNGRPFEDELCGGTMLQYWHAGNPLSIVGFAVTVEEVGSW